jgi:hypothetical protein
MLDPTWKPSCRLAGAPLQVAERPRCCLSLASLLATLTPRRPWVSHHWPPPATPRCHRQLRSREGFPLPCQLSSQPNATLALGQQLPSCFLPQLQVEGQGSLQDRPMPTQEEIRPTPPSLRLRHAYPPHRHRESVPCRNRLRLVQPGPPLRLWCHLLGLSPSRRRPLRLLVPTEPRNILL